MAALRRENISDKLVEIIGNQIIHNKLESGEPIFETHLSREYGISRSPVRDALHVLEQIRLVERNERGNYQVTVLTPKRIENLYDMANILFQYAFSKAAEKAMPEDLQFLRNCLDALERSIQEKDFDLYLSNVTKIAQKVLRVAGNPIVEKSAMELMPTAERVQWATITYLPDQIQKAVAHLKQSYAMVAARKSKEAAKAFENFAYTHKALVMNMLVDSPDWVCA